jgi:hypothetical protein
MARGSKFWIIVIGGGLAAIATAIVAWLTFYFTFFQPKTSFDPKVTFGSPILKEVNGQLSATLVILVSNAGGQAGGIGDMALHIQSKAAKTRWALTPVSLVDIGSYMRGFSEKREVSSSVTAPFSSILLPGNALGSYSVFFMPRAVKNPPLAPLKTADLISDDTYQVELEIVTTGPDGVVSAQGEWKRAAMSEFVLGQDQLVGLKSGLAVIPLDTIRDSLREKFLQ